MESGDRVSAGGRQPGRERQMVVFSLNSEDYGVDIEKIREIIPMQTIVSVPRAPQFVEGIINLRGRVIPVLDLRRHFGFEKKPPGPAQRIVIVEADQECTGVVVDSVSSVIQVPREAIEDPSEVIIGSDVGYIQGVAKVDNDLIVLLDLAAIITEAQKKTLKEADVASAVVR